MRIALISCSKRKVAYACSAQEMYSKSALFNKAIKYCRQHQYDLIFILSAKYGVLSPTDKIDTYELSLNQFSPTEITNWAEKCSKFLLKKCGSESQFDFYAGKNYFEELSKRLPKANNILKGLGIGERLRFLSA